MADQTKVYCSKCNISFSRKSNFNLHCRRFHATEMGHLEPTAANNTICSVCKYSCRSLTELHTHFRTVHTDIRLSFMEKSFYCMEDFEQWKLKIESESRSLFIKHNGRVKMCKKNKSIHYFCHRSGSCKPKTGRKRRFKEIGSLKVGSTCPARIVMNKEVYEGIMKIDVEYQSVHVGHMCEASRLPLTKSERDQLATMMGLGVSKTTVLEYLRKTFPPTERIALTTRKDLHNICRDYKIQNAGLNNNSVVAVDVCFADLSEQSNGNDNDAGPLEIDYMHPEEENRPYEKEPVATAKKLKLLTNKLTFEQRKTMAYEKLQKLANACYACETEKDLRAITEGINRFKASLTETCPSEKMMFYLTEAVASPTK